MPAALYFTGDPEANALIATDPLALTIGFVLDQQVTVQKAFSSPLELSRRIGGLDAGAIAAIDPAVLEEAFRRPPALHRYPANMAKRVQRALPRDRRGVRRRRLAGVERGARCRRPAGPARRAARVRRDKDLVALGRALAPLRRAGSRTRWCPTGQRSAMSTPPRRWPPTRRRSAHTRRPCGASGAELLPLDRAGRL